MSGEPNPAFGRPTSSPRRAVAIVVLMAALAAAVGACGVGVDVDETSSRSTEPGSAADPFSPEVEGGSTSSTPTTMPPPTDLAIAGDTGAPVNRVAANAITDLNAFWTKTYPELFGAPYTPPKGGYHAVDRNSRPSTLPCQPPVVNMVLNNAYYCLEDDAVAWDEEFLMPELAEKYGDFVVAVVMAHEWGHAIQGHAVQGGAATEQPTVVMELQADCYAGAWVKSASTSETSRFEVTTRDLDQALAGVLSLRDAPGAESTDQNAHGSGFDRVSAFQSGYDQGAARCKQFTVNDPRPYQFAFEGDDRYTQGNIDLDQMLTQSFQSLDGYWSDIFPALSGGKAWEAMAAPKPFSLDAPPECNGQVASGFRLFLCIPERYVGYEKDETIPLAYDMGDFAVAALFGTQYGLEVQDQLLRPPGSEATATIRADCFTGAWAAALLPGSQQDPAKVQKYVLTLSPGDLDEAIKVMLTFRTADSRERQGPGFNRVKAFRTGVVSGPGACRDLTA